VHSRITFYVYAKNGQVNGGGRLPPGSATATLWASDLLLLLLSYTRALVWLSVISIKIHRSNGRRQNARTDENVNAVNDLVLSQKGAQKTH